MNQRTLALQLVPPVVGAMGHISSKNPPTVDDAGNVDGDWDERASNKDGYIGFMKVDSPDTVWVLVQAAGYDDELVGPIDMPHDATIEVSLKKSLYPIPSRLHRIGHDLKNEAGVRVEIAGSSFFQGYQWFLDGADWMTPMMQLRDMGCNCLRTFFMDFNIPLYDFGAGPFKPDSYGDSAFDRIPEYMTRAGEMGMYVYWSVFPDVELIYPGSSNQFKRDLFDRFVSKAKISGNGIGEVTNEQDAHSFNSVDPSILNRPSGIPFCSGSYGDIGGPQPFPWDFGDYHVPRGNFIKSIKDSNPVDHPTYQQGYGILLGEGDRMGSVGNPDIELTRLAAGACRESAIGQIFHSTNGKHAKVLDSDTLPHAKVFFKAMGR